MLAELKADLKADLVSTLVRPPRSQLKPPIEPLLTCQANTSSTLPDAVLSTRAASRLSDPPVQRCRISNSSTLGRSMSSEGGSRAATRAPAPPVLRRFTVGDPLEAVEERAPDRLEDDGLCAAEVVEGPCLKGRASSGSSSSSSYSPGENRTVLGQGKCRPASLPLRGAGGSSGKESRGEADVLPEQPHHWTILILRDESPYPPP